MPSIQAVSLVGLAIVLPVQEEGAAPPSPFDRVHELELTADDPALIDGRGPTAVVEYEAEFSGTLHLWTRSEPDLFLRVEDPMTGDLVAEDDDSGGGTTPWIELSVEEGDYLAVLIAARTGELGGLELHAVAAPESDATREAARAAEATLAEIRGLREEGDSASARALLGELVVELMTTPGGEHSERTADVLYGLETMASDLGDLTSSLTVRSAARNHRERTLPGDHPDLLRARANLAVTMKQMGDLPGARALQEAVLAAGERTLPGDHPDLLSARQNMAITTKEMGDLPGARALEEAVLAARERTLPADHPDLLAARSNLAVTMWRMGDLPGARALEEAVLAARERTLPEDHPDLLRSRANLALMMNQMGDLPGARALEEAVLAARERTLPADHPEVLAARRNLAVGMAEMGDLPGARALEEAILDASERTLPADHPDLLIARANLAITIAETGDLPGARAFVLAQVEGMRARVLGSLALAPRQAREAVQVEALRLAETCFLTRSADPPLRTPVFELLETLRMVAGEAARALRSSGDPAVVSVLEEAATVRAALNDRAAGAGTADATEWTRLMQERDRLEREASRLLAEKGVTLEAVELEALVEALGPQDAFVGFRRLVHWVVDEESGRIQAGREHLLAHVVAGGSVKRVDLGPASELEGLVSAWRAALGAPLLRGVALSEKEDREVTAGEVLRDRLLDPLLALLGEGTQRIFVCADDLVFLVPLDALPLEGGRVGDRWSVANEVSCARLLSKDTPAAGEPGLLALGGVDYDADGNETAASETSSSRSALPDRFSKLLQTLLEAETTGLLFEDLLEVEPVVLTKKETTKNALFAHAPGKRYLHLATHGWFASETIKSTMDEEPGGEGWTRMGLQERVTGMAPMLLCGLALAGANNPPDSLGRRPGILTAEELCSLDLSSCDLAVLSACETNVGIRRAGQGIQSLQAALYAAGARSSITSLWKVDDAATRRLMEVFYTKLWEEGLPKAQALWEAKCVLRDEGAPVRDWAGWVLTGDPD